MDNNIVKINFKNSILTFKLEGFQTDNSIDIEDLLNIDYTNLVAEILTFPVILNRLGVLLAEIENYLRTAQLNLELEKDKLKETRALAETEAFKELKKTINSPTIPQITAQALLNPALQEHTNKFNIQQKEVIAIQKDRDLVNSFYWSAKSKDEKLNKLSDKLKPTDFECDILKGRINGVLIKSQQKLIKD